MKLRVGTPPYLVARPLNAGLECEAGVELVRAVPAELVDGLRERRLDVALVSSIELFRRPGYRYVDGAAVVGRGEISSVKLFLRRPLESTSGKKRIVLDPSSRAAQTLTRVLLTKRLGRDALEFVEPSREIHPRDEAERIDADAWLAIGDRALRAFLEPNAPPTFDPASEWWRATGLPFVFAVWIVAPDVELSKEHVRALLAARVRGAGRIEALIAEASASWSLPIAACRQYLSKECVYDPGRELRPALRAFRDAAAELGLADGSFDPEPIALEEEHVAAPH